MLGHLGFSADRKLECLADARRLVALAGSLIEDDGSWTDSGRGREQYDRLKRYDSELVIDAMAKEIVANPRNRLHVLFLAVKLGVGGEARLVQVLDSQGDKKMAEDFINCGSKVLHQAGEQWASRHGYSIKAGNGSNRVSWGSF